MAKEKKTKVEKVSGASRDVVADNIDTLKRLFPQVFKDGKIDFDALKLALGGETDTNGQSYGLSWAGKADCFRHIQEATTATLKPDRKESVDFDNTENIFIEGDNLEVLKVLQKNYYGKVKMIYIDPPYNTGNDSFIYPDRFKEERAEYEERAGIKDAEGLLTKDGFFRKNSKDTGHFHSNWLCMMYPRLFLAKNLLREDGVIFISIGKEELSNLINVCDNEIYGEENRVGVISRLMKSGGSKGSFFSPNIDYILVYAKSIENLKEFRLPLEEAFADRIYKKVENEGEKKGKRYREMGLYQAGLDIRANQRYWIKCPDGSFVIPPGRSIPEEVKQGVSTKPQKGDGVWRWTYDRFAEELKADNIVFKKTETSSLINEELKQSHWNIYTKIWLDDRLDEGRVPTDLIIKYENRRSSAELKELNIPFDFAKPSGLIKNLAELLEYSVGDTILDFFAGSCTTAHAVMKLNAEDGGNRKFVCVQLAEPCEEESEAYKAGFKTIADIGKERIRRAAKKIKAENKGKLDFDGGKLDLGFKVFKLDESNFKQWRETIKTGEELKEQLKMFVDNKKKGSAPEDMLYEIILKNSRFDLNVKLEKKTFDGIEYYRLATEGTEHTENSMEIICLADKITKKLAEKILKEKPQKFTCLDTAFKNNDQLKTNTALQMEAAKIEFKVI